jgi:regulator of sigma E protease
MLLVTILLGIICLGIVVMAHEFGHYFAGRDVGGEVEAFSIGWGPKIAAIKRGATEWRISVFPLGGYCKFKGEESFRQALERRLPELPREEGSLYGVGPWRRIFIAVAGPLANVILAVLIFAAASTIGYSIPTYSNRIVLLSEYDLGGTKGKNNPADSAGLKTGDRIIAIDGRPVSDFYEILQIVTRSPGKSLRFEIERDGSVFSTSIAPLMKADGSGYIGVSNWTETIIAAVKKGSAADIAGLQEGDRIVAVDAHPVVISAEIWSYLNARKPERTALTVERSGNRLELAMVLNWKADGESDFGVAFRGVDHHVAPVRTIGGAVVSGLRETWDTFSATITGLGTLFRGVDVFKALSGPARIINYAGESVAAGIENRSTGGLAFPLNFLGFISVGLFIMNLLPIPALDGGQTLMHLVEVIRRKPLKPITVYRYQLVGLFFIFGIFVLATVGDLIFFASSS